RGFFGWRVVERVDGDRRTGGIGDDPRAGRDASGCDERRERLREQSMDGSLQLARAVLRTGSAFEEQLPRRRSDVDLERSIAKPAVDVVLQFFDVMIEGFRERLRI